MYCFMTHQFWNSIYSLYMYFIHKFPIELKMQKIHVHVHVLYVTKHECALCDVVCTNGRFNIRNAQFRVFDRDIWGQDQSGRDKHEWHWQSTCTLYILTPWHTYMYRYLYCISLTLKKSMVREGQKSQCKF